MEKELTNGRVAEEIREEREEVRRAPRAANLIGVLPRRKKTLEGKGKGKGKSANQSATVRWVRKVMNMTLS